VTTFDTPTTTRVQAREQARATRTAAETQSQIALAQTQSQIALAEAAEKRKADRESREVKAAERRQAEADRREAARLAREDRRERAEIRRAELVERREEKARRRTERVARVRAKLKTLSANGSDLASTVVYGVALVAAMGGQISTAKTELAELPVIAWATIGVVIAVFVEGAAVAAATTAHRVRQAGGRPVMASVLTWLFAAVAAGIQLYGHWQQPILAVVLMSATLTAVTVHEMQTRAKAAIKQIDETRAPVRWGWRRWLVAPGQTTRAWRADILSRTTEDAEALLADAERSRAAARDHRWHRRTARQTRRERRRLAALADRLRRDALAVGVTDWVRLTVVVSDTSGACNRGDCPSASGQYGCPGHTDWEPRVRQADTVRPVLPEADASDSGVIVPASWATGQPDGSVPPLDVVTLMSALDTLSAPDTSDTKPSDTSVSDARVSDSELSEPSGTRSDTDASEVSDTSDTGDRSDSVRPKRTRRRTTRRAVGTSDTKSSDTVKASDASADSRASEASVSDIAAVAERLRETNELSVRRLSDAANITRHAADKWLKSERERRGD